MDRTANPLLPTPASFTKSRRGSFPVAFSLWPTMLEHYSGAREASSPVYDLAIRGEAILFVDAGDVVAGSAPNKISHAVFRLDEIVTGATKHHVRAWATVDLIRAFPAEDTVAAGQTVEEIRPARTLDRLSRSGTAYPVSPVSAGHRARQYVSGGQGEKQNSTDE